eukprot:Stramenopile-MAST_4_protein_2947
MTTEGLTPTQTAETLTPTQTAETLIPNIVIVIPYRHRYEHYKKIAQHLPNITRKGWFLKVILVEQNDEEPFKRAWLMNVGIQETKKRYNNDSICIVTHDVDMIADVKVDYSWCDKPTQICSELSCFKGGVPYSTSAGGVVQASLKDWEKINGFTNTAMGWGGEDDDLHHRFRINGLLTGKTLRRPPKGHGICHCMHDKHHTKRAKHQESYKNILGKIGRMARNSKEWKSDGLNSLIYHIDEEEEDSFGSLHLKVHPTKRKGLQTKQPEKKIMCGLSVAREKLKPPNGPNNFKNWKPLKYSRCAIVGSGGSLVGSNCGTEIDHHDATFRINAAPTQGFEKDVGSFTTFRTSYGVMCAASSVMNFPWISHGLCVAQHTGSQLVNEIFKASLKTLKEHEQRYGDMYRKYHLAETKIESIDDTHMFYHKSGAAGKYYGLSVVNPTSGFNAIVASLDLCEEINLYGFDHGKTLTNGGSAQKAHYYDYRPIKFPDKKNSQVHNYVSEWKTIMSIVRK